MISVETRSGSRYDVDLDGRRIRRVVRSAASRSERVGTGEWRPYLDITAIVVGEPIYVTFGRGRDEHSAGADQFGTEGRPDEDVTRLVTTTPVTSISEVG